MSNFLSVRRVIVQTIEENGKPDGEPTYGVMAADEYAQSYCDIYGSLEELNKAIEEAGDILSVVDPNGDIFDASGSDQIGFENYYVESPSVLPDFSHGDENEDE